MVGKPGAPKTKAMELVEHIEVLIDEAEVLRYLGYKGHSGAVGAPMKEMLEQETARGYALIEPKAGYTLLRVQGIEGESVVLEGGSTLRGSSLARSCRGAAYLAVALCTIGPALEEKVSALFNEGHYVAALVLDSVGTVAAHHVAGYLENVICEKASSLHLKSGGRVSPGSRWALSNQRALFELLPAHPLGVRLTENCMMLPQKSLSFCIGIGKQVATKRAAHNCQRCQMHHCLYRKADFTRA